MSAMNSPGETRNLSELKVHYRFLSYVVSFVVGIGGSWMGLVLLVVAAMILGVDIHQPLGQSAKTVFALLGVGAVASGAYVGTKAAKFVLVATFALLGQVKWSDLTKTIRNFDFPKQWLKTPPNTSGLAPSKKC